MENFAKKVAINHNISKFSNKKTYPLNSLKEDYEIIEKAFDILTESVSKNVSIQPAGEWLLDNFYIIEEQYNAILNDFTLKEYVKLPAVDGEARIYLIAAELVEYTDGNITEEIIENFVKAYGSKRTLNMDEIWKLPLMIRIALIKHISKVSDKIITAQLEKFKVESLLERVIMNKEVSEQKFREYRNIDLNGEVLSYIEYMIYSLKKLRKRWRKIFKYFRRRDYKSGNNI